MKRLLALAASITFFAVGLPAQSPISTQTSDSSIPVASCAKPAFPGKEWKRNHRSKSDGWSQSKLAAAQQYANSLHDQSVMIVQCGRLVDEWGDPSKKLTTFSVRKSLISALYGISNTQVMPFPVSQSQTSVPSRSIASSSKPPPGKTITATPVFLPFGE